VYPLADPASRRRRVIDVADIKKVSPVAIGDIVELDLEADGSGRIRKILSRKNSLSRKASGPKMLEQVLVANIDLIVPVFALVRPKPKWNLLDRYLAIAESTGIRPLICITKSDLAQTQELPDEINEYERIGYSVVITSALTGEGLKDLKARLQGNVSVLAGKSGVGKTTLLNALQPDLGLDVAEVSGATGKGKHTTTSLEMFDLEDGGSIIDTPGMRELGLWNLRKEELPFLFPEIRPFLDHCRFGSNCSHIHEPDCAVKEAVTRGLVSERRYSSLCAMLD